MKHKTLLGIIVSGCLFAGAVFGQTIQFAGTVSDLSSSQITMQVDSDKWVIKRTRTTKVISGELKVGSKATVECLSPDAQRKE